MKQPAQSADSPDQLLAELEAALNELLALAGGGDFDGVDSRISRLDRLIGSAKAVLASSQPCHARRAERIARLHRELVLALAASKQETADKLARLHRGKSSLRAYRANC